MRQNRIMLTYLAPSLYRVWEYWILNEKRALDVISVFDFEIPCIKNIFVSVPLKNGEDYQYKVNGTIYSLNMDECFREDEGIYTIRSVLILFNFKWNIFVGAREFDWRQRANFIFKIKTVYILTYLFQSG